MNGVVHRMFPLPLDVCLPLGLLPQRLETFHITSCQPANQLICSECSFTGVVVIQVMVHQARVVTTEAVKHKEELEFKRMFVRYISHEVRTPLNTAIMGLQVLYEELEGSHSECLDTVQDCKISCDIAVNVLNELLTFDKLEAGTLMVEKTPFNDMELIEETVNPFQKQTNVSKITLKVKVRSVRPGDSQLRAVSLHADRNKISQIIRNLVPMIQERVSELVRC